MLAKLQKRVLQSSPWIKCPVTYMKETNLWRCHLIIFHCREKGIKICYVYSIVGLRKEYTHNVTFLKGDSISGKKWLLRKDLYNQSSILHLVSVTLRFNHLDILPIMRRATRYVFYCPSEMCTRSGYITVTLPVNTHKYFRMYKITNMNTSFSCFIRVTINVDLL